MARILITSALPYINGIKHLGNLAGSMLPADVWARFKRAQGHEVLYICATDEHGTPAELAAAAAGALVRRVVASTDRDVLDADNADLIAQLRVSAEGQEGLGAYLDKRTPSWANGGAGDV